jgi:hypothetical protein
VDAALARFRLVSQIDDAWHANMSDGLIEYDQADDDELLGYFRDWLATAETIAKRLECAAAEEIPDEAAREFHDCLVEARGVLTPDSEFFTGEALDRLVDAALEAHRRGETVEMHDISD